MAKDFLGGLGRGTEFLGDILETFGNLQTSKENTLVQQLNAAVARANAQALRSSISAIETAGEFDIRRLQRVRKRLRAVQGAGYAKAGVRQAGSALEVMIDSAAEAQIDILISQYGTKSALIQRELEADITDIEARGSLERAKIASKLAKKQFTSSLLSTVGSLGLMFAGGGGGGKTATVKGRGTVPVAPKNYYLSHGSGY